MNIEIVAKNLEIDADTRSFAERQLQKSARFMEAPIDVRLMLGAEKHRRTADLHVAHRFGVIQATEETGDLREAIRLAVEKATKQAKRSRQKFKDRRRRRRAAPAPEWPVDVLAVSAVEADEAPRIIEKLRVPIATMDLIEAAAALEASALGFQVFRDKASRKVNILYRRDPDHYGLITPEL